MHTTRTIPRLGATFAALSLCQAPSGAQHHLYTFDGHKAGDGLGWSVSGAGDVDRDGFADVIVGAPYGGSNGVNSGEARVLSGRTGAVLYEFSGDSADDFFGTSVSGAGDVNGDGYDDLIVGAPFDDNNGRTNSGSARVFSGKDGTILFTFDGAAAGDNLGWAVRGAGDVNRDGHDDVILGAYLDATTGIQAGSARVHSGKDGTVLYTFRGTAGDEFGFSVSGAGDVDKDGCADVIVGAPYADQPGSSDCGRAQVFSGKDGSVVWTFHGTAAGDHLGWSVSGAGDVNRDGHDDLLVGAPDAAAPWINNGSALLFDGNTGRAIYRFNGNSAGDRLGTSVSGAGDVDGDGDADVILGAYLDDPNGRNDAGSAEVRSGQNGQLLHVFHGDSASDVFGSAVSGAGDVNGDGFADLIVGAYWDDNKGRDSGSARLLSGAKLRMWSDRHEISVNTGGTQSLSLSAGTAHAGRTYWVFGSLSGTAPGVPLGGVTIPLKLDPWTDITIASPNTSVLVRTRGTLDAAGNGTAAIVVPPVSTAAIGLEFHHAFVVFDASNGRLHLASNPVPLTLIK